MSNPPPVTGHFAHADPNAAPLTLNELIDILNSLLSVQINGSYIPYVVQHGTPGADQSDFAWIELDSGGRPLSMRIYYNGRWRKIYTGMIGEIRMYSGDPGDGDIWTPLGHGVVGGDYDGWQICNGNNNSPDLSDKFIVGAHMNNKDGHTGYNKHWQTFVDGKSDLQSGGSKDHMIVQNELPPFNPTGPVGATPPPPLGTNDVTIHGNEFKDGTTHTDAHPIVDVNYGNQLSHDFVIGHYGASPHDGDPQQAISILPPFYAFALIIFQGYTT
jgi:hypothetical protein